MAKVELLAPAGNIESLNSALASGADAIYLGMDDFNARKKLRIFQKIILRTQYRKHTKEMLRSI